MHNGISLGSFAESGHLSEEVKATAGVSQGSVVGPLLFLAYVNDIGRKNEFNIWLFTDDCIIYRKIMYINILGEWVVENEMKIIQAKVKL
jgi:hypothetical protein